ncbi:MAG: hypothetical protein ACR2JO_02050 [Mycobacteriales bacterium]
MKKVLGYCVLAVALLIAAGSVALGVQAAGFIVSTIGETGGVVITTIPKVVPAFQAGQKAAGGGGPAPSPGPAAPPASLNKTPAK